MSKYYVVSEEELLRYRQAAIDQAQSIYLRWSTEDQEAVEAGAACKAREVTLKSTFRNGVGGGVNLCEEIKR